MPFKTTSALIAGEGKMPLLIAKEMISQGIKPLIIAFEGKHLENFEQMGLEGYSLHPTQVAKACRLMHFHGVKEVTWAGRIHHRVIMDVRPWHLSFDLIRLWFSLSDTRADTLLSALCHYFEQHGIHVLSSLRYLSRFILKSVKHSSLSKDALLGIATAKTLGALDVGQSVVVRKGTVVALEAMEGTDRCLDRAIELGSLGATFVKMAKPSQDLRFDVPVIGETTFERLVRGGFSSLVVEENQTLCLDPEALKKAQAAGLEVFIIGQKEIDLALKTYAAKWQGAGEQVL